jgi:hypothetical protein
MKTQPVKDADFIAWALNIKTQCTAHQMDWQLDADMVSTLGILVDNGNTAYLANANPETTNRATSAAKRAAFKTLKPFMSNCTMALVVNTHVPDDALDAMGLPSRTHHYHTPLPEPGEEPDIHAVVGQHGVVTVYVKIPQQGHPSEYMTRKGYHGFVVQYRKAGDTEWREEHTTRLHISLSFDSEDTGKNLEVKAAWINPRLQRGPWSDAITVLIN